MVDLVLNDLGCPSGKGFQPFLELLILPAYFDRLPPPDWADPCEGEAALLRVIGTGLLDNLRVKHDQIVPVVVKNDDPLVYADHVGRHTYTAGLVIGQRLQQIGGDGQIIW